MPEIACSSGARLISSTPICAAHDPSTRRLPALIGTSHFVGIDLAWSARNPSGVAALRLAPDGGRAALIEPLPAVPLYSDDEIITYLEPFITDGAVLIGIDAPLTVPNRSGRRLGDAALTRAFTRFHAGAHPANRARLEGFNGGVVRGEALVARLTALGIAHDPVLKPRQPARQVFEVYPHPAMIVLFGLDHILKYKARKGVSPADRRAAFRTYQGHLRDLGHAEPALDLPQALLDPAHLKRRGGALKRYEDQLDAILCAYVAFYCWWWGNARCHIFGNTAGGYILTPVDARTRPAPTND
jgi:predicted RNase H-like nuclease